MSLKDPFNAWAIISNAKPQLVALPLKIAMHTVPSAASLAHDSGFRFG